jgi:excisionase family DNA binding protein
MPDPLANPNAKSALPNSTATDPDDYELEELLDGLLVTKPRTVSVEEAGRILGIGRMPAYNAVWRGQIPSIRIGRRLLVPVAKLKALLGETDDEPLSAA